MQIYGEITKVEPLDDGTIRVSGVASSGAVDEADETVLPAAMKAALPAYMRFGALREMHGLSAAGATLHADVDDDGLTRIETHVVDPLAVKKVRTGVYKGFSIGGKVLARDANDRRVITQIKLDEISLVDRPCNPEAVIDMWKAERASPDPATPPTNAEVLAQAKQLAARAGKPRRHADYVVKAREVLMRAAASAKIAPDQDDDDADAETADPASIADQLDAILAPLDPDDAAEALADLMDRWSAGDSAGAAKTASFQHVIEPDRLTRAAEIRAETQIEDLRRALIAMEDRLEKLAAQPAAPKAAAGAVRAIGKTEDATPLVAGLSADEFHKYLAALPEDERGQIQLRAALKFPIPLDRF